MTEPLKLLSLGAGVQSSTAFWMSCRGALPKLDGAIFADTGWEPRQVYEYLAMLKEAGAAHGIPVYQVSAGDLRAEALNARIRQAEYGELEGGRWASLPLFTKNADGSVGKIKRQCTKEYKIEPIRRQCALLLKNASRPKAAGAVQQWIGISRDEMRRMRQSNVRYVTNHYPLIFDQSMTRADCLRWLEANDLPIPSKSACKGCPFRSNAEWRQIQADPEEWLDVVEFDRAIRATGGVGGETFLHKSCLPLDQVDLSTAEERGQGNWLKECSGYCGV